MCISVLVLFQHDYLFGDFIILGKSQVDFNTFNVYKAFNFRKIKNLFMVSARVCENYFLMKVLLYTPLKMVTKSQLMNEMQIMGTKMKEDT